MPMLGAGGGSAIDRAKAQLQAAASGGGGGMAVQQGPMIPVRGMLGTVSRPVNQGEFDGDIHTVSPDVRQRAALTSREVMAPDAAVGAWYSFTDDDRTALMRRMWYLGLTKSPTDFDSAYSVWKAAVAHAAGFAAAGKPVDPRDVLEMLADGQQGAGTKKTSQHTTTSIDLTNPETAKQWVQEAFHQSMGRNAEAPEVRAFADALLAEERKHPTVSTTTANNDFDAMGNPVGNTSTVTTGGFNSDDAKAFFAHRLSSDPEANAHQAAADLFPALMQALGSGVG